MFLHEWNDSWWKHMNIIIGPGHFSNNRSVIFSWWMADHMHWHISHNEKHTQLNIEKEHRTLHENLLNSYIWTWLLAPWHVHQLSPLRHPGVDEAQSVESNFHLNLSSWPGLSGGISDMNNGKGQQTFSGDDVKWSPIRMSNIEENGANRPNMWAQPEWLQLRVDLETFHKCQDLLPVIPNLDKMNKPGHAAIRPGWTVHSKHSNDLN